MEITKQRTPILRVLAIILFICPLCVSSIIAQNDETECPYFNIETSDSTGVNLSLLATNVDVTISGIIANVEIEQAYYNAGDSTLDATYVFPMSSQAAVYGMDMIVNDRVIQAVIKRKEEANEIFETANENGHTATLLEQHRPNVFQMSLANIKSKDTIKVRMVYTEILQPIKGVYQFVFPTIVGPRYTMDGEEWVSQTIQSASDIQETELNINMQINASSVVAAKCESHDIEFDIEPRQVNGSISTTPGNDFIVEYYMDNDVIKSGLLLYEGEEENFFLSIIQPPRLDVEFDSPPREYIFIMDVSGSMSGEPIEVSKQLISDLLNDLTFEDRFNIVFFAGASSTLSDTSLPVTADNIKLAQDAIDNVQAGGGTRILSALDKALNMSGTEDFSRSFVILSDGYVNVEKEVFRLIRENLNEANFFALGIGRNVNRYIIEGIAYVGEGESFVATNGADASEIAESLRRYINRPALTNIEVAFDGIEVYDIEPLTIPDVFSERPVLIYGKYNKPTSGTFHIEGDYAEGRFSNSLSFEDYSLGIEDNIALKYLWARKRIKLMSDYCLASNESDTLSIEEEITRLGLKYSLVTEFTSFVAVDSTTVIDPLEPDEDDDGDVASSVFEVEEEQQIKKKAIIKVLGPVQKEEGILRLRFEEINYTELQDPFIEIFSLSGERIAIKELLAHDLNDDLTIELGQIPQGIYIVSLSFKW